MPAEPQHGEDERTRQRAEPELQLRQGVTAPAGLLAQGADEGDEQQYTHQAEPVIAARNPLAHCHGAPADIDSETTLTRPSFPMATTGLGPLPDQGNALTYRVNAYAIGPVAVSPAKAALTRQSLAVISGS